MKSSTLHHTTDVVIAYAARNTLSPGQLCKLVSEVATTIDQLGERPAPQEPQAPAVPIKKSIRKGYLICLEDGRKFKTMKRHLMAAYGLTPDQYRKKWGLPSDYPMTARAYSAARAELAKQMGLGRVGRADLRLVS